MDGLTNIIAKISEQNDADCKAALENAREKAEKIMADAEASSKEISERCAAEAAERIKVIDSKAVSSSELEYKRVLLSKKSEIIDSVVKKAVEDICGAESDVYFGYIEALVAKNALPGEGCVKMSGKDLSRIPDGFEKRLNSMLSDGKSVVISSQPEDFSGGVVIDYPEIRIDCTIASLVEDRIDEIRDEINRVLFA